MITSNPLEIVALLIALILAITFHEASHGFVARLFGDMTATAQGRVTFNPIKHIDPMGTIIMPGLLLLMGAPFLFGYAKPVPVNERYLKPQRLGMICVAAAGPFSNLVLAWISAMLLHVNPGGESLGNEILIRSIQFNIVLAIFNMLPIPPLDGGRVAVGILPRNLGRSLARVEPYGFLILLALIMLPSFLFRPMGIDFNPLQSILVPAVNYLTKVILYLSGLL